MALHEVFSPTPAPKERIHQALVMEAAKRVRVSEYLQLRYQSKRGHLSGEEYRQIRDGATAIMYDAAKSDNRPYDPGDNIERSTDPRVGWARRKLTNVPLGEYLAARHKLLEAAVAGSTKKAQDFENLVGFEEEAGKAFIRKLNLENGLFLTEKVAAAAGIDFAASAA